MELFADKAYKAIGWYLQTKMEIRQRNMWTVFKYNKWLIYKFCDLWVLQRQCIFITLCSCYEDGGIIRFKVTKIVLESRISVIQNDVEFLLKSFRTYVLKIRLCTNQSANLSFGYWSHWYTPIRGVVWHSE